VSAGAPLIGRLLADRYRVEAEIARGGMASVWRARDVRLERDVAVKVLAPPSSNDPSFTERFLGEARAAASLSHPSLVHVYDSGSDGDAHFIVMELLDRHRTLRDVIAERGRLPRDEVVRIGRELLAGLRIVHERGLVHCDVKPANVMLGPGPAKLIDFGIATAPHDGAGGETSLGSLRYMSPEQLHGQALTPASDLFSLAATLYEALTGRPPYVGASPQEVSAAHAADRVRPPSTIVEGIGGRLDMAIIQALRREPTARFSTAAAMDRALEAAYEDEPRAGDDEATRVVPVVPPPRPAEPARAAGYVPPPAPPAPPAPTVRRRAPAPPPPRRPAQRRRAIPWGLIGSMVILATVALVVLLLVVPLIRLGQGGGGGDAPTPTPATSTTPAPQGTLVTVPDLVGEPTQDAIAAARDAGLDWTVYCNQDPAQPEGIIDQEPPPGTEVARGSAFSLYSARIADCQ
jgi:eukaryotic-like serine/threonine-protein kinase